MKWKQKIECRQSDSLGLIGAAGFSKTGRPKARPLGSPFSVVLYEFSLVASQRVVERLDKCMFVDEIVFPLHPRRENFLCFICSSVL